MALPFAFMIIVITADFEKTKEALDMQAVAAFVVFSWLGVVGLVNPFGGLLKQHSDQLVGGLKKGCPNQKLQFLNRRSVSFLGAKLVHQLMNFSFLRQSQIQVVFF